EAGTAAGAAQRGDGLQPARLDLLKVDVVAALAEELVEEERDLRLLGLEAGNADEGAGQLDQLPRIDVPQHRARQLIHERARLRPAPPAGGEVRAPRECP